MEVMMLERFVKWLSKVEVGPIGRVYLIGLMFLSIGVGYVKNLGGGYIMFGSGVIFYAILRFLDSFDWSSL
jgi:hypothetical protein